MRTLFTSSILMIVFFFGCTKPNTVDWGKILGDKDNVAITDEDALNIDDIQSDNDAIPDSCGDLHVDAGEVCDGGLADCVDIDPEKFISGKAYCRDDCSGYDTITCEESLVDENTEADTVLIEEDTVVEEDQSMPEDENEILDDAIEAADDGAETDEDAVDADTGETDTVDVDAVDLDTVDIDTIDIDTTDIDTVDVDTTDIDTIDIDTTDIDFVDVDLVPDVDVMPVLCTGQISCFNNTTAVSCPSVEDAYYGQDAQYAAFDYCMSRDYTVDGSVGSDIVTDNRTGLIWQRTLSGVTYSWSDAVTECALSNYGGYDDWRLPAPEELETILDYGRYSPPLNAVDFPAAPAVRFWTAETSVGDNTKAWYVHFDYGWSSYHAATNLNYVRCVRGPQLNLQSALTTMTVGGDAVVTDDTTGLLWADEYATDFNWQNALSYCEDLDYAGYTHWRLPNINELKSLLRRENYDPASNFPGMPSIPFWSSTSRENDPDYAWESDFIDGYVGTKTKTLTGAVRCVRSDVPEPDCGDGIHEMGEECDDGDISNNDDCKNDCTLNVCGDGYLNVGFEICEIGDTNTCDNALDETGITGDVPCNNACNGWDTIGNCTQTYTCAAKPATGTDWNTVSSYTQTWNGTAWSTADSTTTYNTTPSTTECRFKCQTNYTWNGSVCVADTRTYNCTAKPQSNETIYNTVSSYLQTWNGSAWSPADDATTEYNTTASTNSCQYKCAIGFVWNGTECTLEECITGEWKIENGMVSECVSKLWIVRRTTKQWGTSNSEIGRSIAFDGLENIFVTGNTYGSLDGNTNAGDMDIFLTKWNVDGSKAWTEQWGTSYSDIAFSVAVDSTGNIFVAGYTEGGLDGNTKIGNYDVFLTKWNADGTKAWTKQWGTSSADQGYFLTLDSLGNIFVTGGTYGSLDGNANAGDQDIFLTKWNADGTKAWTKQWGSSSRDTGRSVVIDSMGNVFVTGYTLGSLDGNTNAGSWDIFLTKWNADGTKAWTKQWGTISGDESHSVAVDEAGNVFVTGDTQGNLDGNTNAGVSDIFLTKWDADGTKAWTRQWGTNGFDYGDSVVVDGIGDVLVTGGTDGGLDGNTSAGDRDIFLTKWNADGTKTWTKQWGTSGLDRGYSVMVDETEKIFVTGDASGELDGNPYAGSQDIILTKLY